MFSHHPQPHPHPQEMVSVAIHNVQDLEIIVKDSHKHITNGTCHENTPDPYKHFVSVTGCLFTKQTLNH